MRTIVHCSIEGPHGSAWARHREDKLAETCARRAYRDGAKIPRCPVGLRVRFMRYRVSDEAVFQVRWGFESQTDLFEVSQ